MSRGDELEYVGRAGLKLKHALSHLGADVRGLVAADFGCSVGGFTDCLLKEGVRRVYAVDTAYGTLEWKLRNDDRVVVLERTNAMHVELPERVDLVTADVGWTRQRYILPNALKQLGQGGFVLSLFKPQYEADPALVHRGIVSAEDFEEVLEGVLCGLKEMGVVVESVVRLPHPKESKNPECFLYILGDRCDLKEQFWPGSQREK